MRTLAIKQPTNDSAKQKKNGDRGRSRLVSPLSTGMPLLQPKCACGGGCPRCQEEVGIQTKLQIDASGGRFEIEESQPNNYSRLKLPTHKLSHSVPQFEIGEVRKVYRAIADQPTMVSPSDDELSLLAEPLSSVAETTTIEASVEEDIDGNSDSSQNGQDICRGTQDTHSTLIFLGRFPPAVVADFGDIFNPVQRAINSNTREMGIHLPVLNNKPLLKNYSTVANQIKGVEPGTEQDAMVECEKNRCRAFFNPANQPQRNLAESYIVLPPSGTVWRYNNADASKVANWIASHLAPNRIPIDESRGTIDDCWNRTKSITVQFSLPEQVGQIVEKHEKRHAEDWGKVFCRVIGHRDRRVGQRTGSNNATTGLALNNPLKAKERALKKLFRGIDTKLETAQKLNELQKRKANQLHSTTRLNFQMRNLVIGSQCEAVILNIEPQSRGNEDSALASDSDFILDNN
ncbi:MAG TPA: hypothetical protein DDZ80_08870 [Cyanobacteria bacterium UBA8803]|nr:hypothetical protein [Cyanobacteria bacterium UBA9273]HBL58611.1 hypothetical protein [Cyanobacteria bacterium UBA8803]